MATTLVLVAFAAWLFVAPGATVAMDVHQDVWTYFDVVHRVAIGHTPHVDFHAPVGALAYLLPALGYRVLGRFAGSFEFAYVVMLAVTLPLTAILLYRRATVAVATIVLLAVGGMVVVPSLPGGSGLLVTHAGFYNRWGWGLIAVLFLAALPLAPRGSSTVLVERARLCAEVATIASILLLLFFLKMTYFLVGFVFVVLFGVVLARFFRSALLGLALFAVSLLAVSLATGIVDDYLRDLGRVLAVTRDPDAHRLPTPTLLDVVLGEFIPISLAVIAIGVAALQGRLAGSQIAFFGFVIASSTVLAQQNSAAPYLFALINVFVAAAGLCPRGSSHRRLVVLAMCLFLSPDGARQLVTSASFHIVAGGDFKMFAADLPRFANVWFGNRAVDWFAANADADAPSAFLWSRRNRAPPHVDLSAGEHLVTLRSGLALLREHGVRNEPVATLDYVNCFPALLNGAAPRGLLLNPHLGRQMNHAIAENRDVVFADAAYLMIPKFPVMQDSTTTLLTLHREHLRGEWMEVAANEHWRLLAKRDNPSEHGVAGIAGIAGKPR